MLWWASSESVDCDDSTLREDIAEPIEPIDANDPMLPTDAHDATEPIDRTERVEQIESSEPRERQESTRRAYGHRGPARPVLSGRPGGRRTLDRS